jgi:glycosyltransferase involved in cell wall biosynthesis
MVLPSYSENFGISLMESLAFGKPVLTTFKVNTYQTILDYNAGYITNTNLNSFANIIKKFENLDQKRKLKMSKNAKNCFEEKFNLINKKSFIPNFDNINQKN